MNLNLSSEFRSRIAAVALSLAVFTGLHQVAVAQSGSTTTGSSTIVPPATQGSGSATMGLGSATMGSGSSGSMSKKVTVAMGGYCPVCILEMKKWVKGDARFYVDVEGKRYLFPGEKQKKMFASNMAKYAPALNGDCIVCYVDGKVRASGSVHHAAFHQGRLFLFPGPGEKAKFMQNPKKYENADLALGGMCSVCRVEMQKDVPGKPEFGTVYQGKRYYFPGAAQLKMFMAQPAKYAAP